MAAPLSTTIAPPTDDKRWRIVDVTMRRQDLGQIVRAFDQADGVHVPDERLERRVMHRHHHGTAVQAGQRVLQPLQALAAKAPC